VTIIAKLNIALLYVIIITRTSATKYYIHRLKGPSDASFLTTLGTEPCGDTWGNFAYEACSQLQGGRLGLLFGGGVESLTALSFNLHLKPALLSLHEPMWMNNDYSVYPLKKKLEDQLAERYNLQIIRVWHDLRPLFNETDEYVNQWITGGFMYYSLVPQMRELNIHLLLQASELEYALVCEQYDRSIHPSFINNIARKPLPPIFSVLNAITKVELLDLLYSSNSELCRYIYSCLRNSERRWCGECGKCRRISAFCKAVAVPFSLIEMQEDIPHIRETGELTNLYGRSLDNYLAKNKASQAFSRSARKSSFLTRGAARMYQILRARSHH